MDLLSEELRTGQHILGGFTHLGADTQKLAFECMEFLFGLIPFMLGLQFCKMNLHAQLISLLLQSVFDFLIIAFVIFMVVKQVNRFKKEAPPPPPPAPPEPTNEEKLLTEIRDLLKSRH